MSRLISDNTVYLLPTERSTTLVEPTVYQYNSVRSTPFLNEPSDEQVFLEQQQPLHELLERSSFKPGEGKSFNDPSVEQPFLEPPVEKPLHELSDHTSFEPTVKKSVNETISVEQTVADGSDEEDNQNTDEDEVDESNVNNKFESKRQKKQRFNTIVQTCNSGDGCKSKFVRGNITLILLITIKY